MNVCNVFITTINQSIVVLANYSHIIPIILSMFLGSLVFLKARSSLFSKVFFGFIITFALWLLGDLITWTQINYYLIYTVWSFLDYMEILFFALGLYFAILFVRKSDMSVTLKTLLFMATVFPFVLTIQHISVAGFNQPQCEAFNNDFLGLYKLIFEGVVLTIMLLYALNPLFQKISWQEKKPSLVVLGSMFLFLSTFGVTEYIASVTGHYEINLYSLFLLPVFLIAIIYSVFELDIFNFKVLGTHYIVVGLVILMSGQLFFIDNTTNRFLTILTILLAIALSFILFRNLKRESDQRIQISKLNKDLENLLKQRESLVHLVTHKVKGSFTRSKYIFASILDGTFGDISNEIRKISQQGMESDNIGIETVDLVLNVSNMQKGTVKYEMKQFNLKEVVDKVIAEKKIYIEERGLKLDNQIKDGLYNVNGDVFWLKEAINNLVDNAIKYTRAGTITVNLENKNGKIILSVRDTGVGITDEDKLSLFTEGGRGKNSLKVNIDSTGYGLYSVKLIADAHNGRVWAESEGVDKGSTFYLELAAI